MEEKRINFETAKLINKLGFEMFDCGAYYHINQGYTLGYIFCYSDNAEQSQTSYLAPTQEILHKWLRENHKLHIVIIPTVTMYWTYKICNIGNETIEQPPYKDVCANDFQTYEEALEDALKSAMAKIIKTVK